MFVRQLRLFIAVNFPNNIKRNLGSIIQELRLLPSDAKWVEEENIHLTVQFLGNVPKEQVPDVVTALSRSVAGVVPFRLELDGVGVFPSVKRPRVLWVGLSGQTAVLARLHRQVRKELGRLGFEPEKRKFLPHLTLARVRSPLRFSDVMEKAEELVHQHGNLNSAKIASIELMLSELSPKGPRYSVLARIPFTGSNQV